MEQLICHLFGDYILQSDWMAQNKTKRSWPALVHALLYSLCFVPLCWALAGPNIQQVLPKTEVTLISAGCSECTGYKVIQAADKTIVEFTGTGKPAHFRWLPWLVIFGIHFLIDRFRLARYVVWAKNWMGPWSRMETIGEAVERMKSSGELPVPVIPHGHKFEIVRRRIKFLVPLSECPTGYAPTTPIWLSTWLLIIADNTLHLAINYAALRWL